MDKIKVIQIGMGHDHAAMIIETLLALDDFEVAAIAVPSEEAGRYDDRYEWASKLASTPVMTVEEALAIPDLTAAVIECEERWLTKYARLGGERGLHIHMDKPSGFDHAEFCAMVDLLEEKQLTFTTGYMYRHNPVIIDAFERVARGEIGPVYAVEAQMGGEHPAEKRQWLEQFPGGMTFFLGCHLVDLIYRLQGEPDEIIPLNCCTAKEGVTADDYGMVVYKYPHGVSFAKSCVAEPGGFMRRQLVICGERGTIEIRPLEINCLDHADLFVGDQVTRVRSVEGGHGWNHDAPFETTPMYNRYKPMMAHFAAVVRGEVENAYSYEYERALNRVVMRSCGVPV